jgi:hypothetical protein
MKTSTPASKAPKASHKFGANRNETARRTRTRDANFSQSRDIREDRGQRQAQTTTRRQTLSRGMRKP